MSKRPKLKKTSIPGTGKQNLQTPCGVVHSIWEPQAPITIHGDLPYFSEYLFSGELFFKWCKDCPLEYRSNNAPKVADVMGMAVLSVLSGHIRFCHGAALCGDKVVAELLAWLIHKLRRESCQCA